MLRMADYLERALEAERLAATGGAPWQRALHLKVAAHWRAMIQVREATLAQIEAVKLQKSRDRG